MNWFHDFKKALAYARGVDTRIRNHSGLRLVMRCVMYRGTVDCIGYPFGVVIVDVHNLPWVDIVGVPCQFTLERIDLAEPTVGYMELTNATK
jgi:hypothetical protein